MGGLLEVEWRMISDERIGKVGADVMRVLRIRGDGKKHVQSNYETGHDWG